MFKGCHCVRNYFPLYFNHFCFICNQNIATVRDPKYIDVIYINERCTQLNKILLNMFSILPPIISPDHFVCTMGGVVFFVTILKWHPAASNEQQDDERHSCLTFYWLVIYILRGGLLYKELPAYIYSFNCKILLDSCAA